MKKTTKATRVLSGENKTHVLSIRLKSQQLERLQRLGRQLGKTASESAALLIEEGLRRSEFAYIDFRSTLAGRHAYIAGTRLSVWMVMSIARNYSMDTRKVAEHLAWGEHQVQAAFNYASAFPEEINDAIAENDSYDFEKLSRELPQARLFVAEPGVEYVTRTVSKGKSPKKRQD